MPRAPQYIETVHRRGFRFIAGSEEHELSRQPNTATRCQSKLFGRQLDIAHLRELLDLAVSGERQLCFVTGEPGIGKTSLVKAFLDTISAQVAGETPLVGQGQGIDQHGEGEAYLPLLEALDRLARGPKGQLVLEQLQHYAPTWLIQMPWLLPSSDPAYDPQLLTATSARMLREFCVLLESLAADTPVVLWLEDLHWSDAATINLLDAMARRESSSRILVVATYRPVDAAILAAPVCQLKQSLVQHNSAIELPLELLTADAVGEYLAERYSGIAQLTELIEMIYEMTDGNPLFVVTLADYLVYRQLLTREQDSWTITAPLNSIKTEISGSLRGIIELQLEQATELELSLLETASVVGSGFCARAIASMQAMNPEEVESVCDQLAKRGQFLVTARPVEWSDNSISQGYEFIHDVYRRTLYDRLTPARLQRLHVRAGDALEAGYSGQPKEVAAELALHFEIGRDPERAIACLRLAAEGARQRAASVETTAYLKRALKQVAALPPRADNESRELDLRLRLMRALMTISGYSTAEHSRNLLRALELCENLRDSTSELQILALQSVASMLAGDLEAAESILGRARKVGVGFSDPVLLSHEPAVSGITALAKGQTQNGRRPLQAQYQFTQRCGLARAGAPVRPRPRSGVPGLFPRFPPGFSVTPTRRGVGANWL